MAQKKAMILLGAAAAYAAYRYSKMTPDAKASLKEKGKKIVDDYLPENWKNMLGLGENKNGAKASDYFKSGF